MLGAIVYEDEPWSMEFKENPSVCILELRKENRDKLPKILTTAFTNGSLFCALREYEQRRVYMLLRELIESKQFISAEKLFGNAILYAVEKRIKQRAQFDTGVEYEVAGKVRNHKIFHRTKDNTFDCDCDLANGKGTFETRTERCSHELSILLTLPNGFEQS